MTELNNTLLFTRVESDRIFYSDLNTSLIHANKFDVFTEEHKQIATLLTNNSKTYTLSLDGINLSIQSKSNWLNKFTYFIYQDTDTLLATIEIIKPLFWKTNSYSIYFEKLNEKYHLKEVAVKNRKYSNSTIQFDFYLKDNIVCSIIDFKKTGLFYLPTTRNLEGKIEFHNSVDLKQILCFLQLVNLQITFEFDM